MMFNIHRGVVRWHLNTPTPSPLPGAGFPLHRAVAGRLRCARRDRSRQGRRVGPGRAGVTETRRQAWDCSRRARAGHLPERLQSHPIRGGGQVLNDICKLSRVQTTVFAQPAGTGAAPPAPSCPPFLGRRARVPPDWGGQRLGTIGATFSRHPKISGFWHWYS